ncbi:hypothetical protein AB0G86_02370 [Streptomyces scabiei]|uniref:hypothetical protein n=1 Tax=Streptomyces scabiei TaxID=1930 RepID=UPI0033FFCB14
MEDAGEPVRVGGGEEPGVVGQVRRRHHVIVTVGPFAAFHGTPHRTRGAVPLTAAGRWAVGGGHGKYRTLFR